MSRWPTQKDMDRWLPTIARYAGLVMIVGLTAALISGHTEVTPGFVPATGLLLYKTVKDAAGGGGPEQ